MQILNSGSVDEKSQYPWILSSFNAETELTYPDSLDKNDSIQQSITDNSSSHRFQTATTFLWEMDNQQFHNQYFDSIDSNTASSLYHPNGEELAECDSLERHLSGLSYKK